MISREVFIDTSWVSCCWCLVCFIFLWIILVAGRLTICSVLIMSVTIGVRLMDLMSRGGRVARVVVFLLKVRASPICWRISSLGYCLTGWFEGGRSRLRDRRLFFCKLDISILLLNFCCLYLRRWTLWGRRLRSAIDSAWTWRVW